MDCRVLSTESEKLELRRCLRGFEISAMVDARPNKRLRIGESLCRAVLFAMSAGVSLEGLIVRSRSMVRCLCLAGGGSTVNDEQLAWLGSRTATASHGVFIKR